MNHLPITSVRFVALVVTALALTMESAHVLEFPPKLDYAAQMYSAVNESIEP